MSRQLFDYNIKKWQGYFPEEGISHFIFSTTIDKEGNLGTIKNMIREFTVFCESNNSKFSRIVKLKTISSDVTLNLGSSSVITILNQLFSIYDDTILKVKFDGTILKIENYIEIQTNWKKIKHDIEKSYKGNSIRRFVRSVESRLETEEKMIKDISSFENFGLLFHPIYGKYDSVSPCSQESQFVGVKKTYSIKEEIKLLALNDTYVVLSVENDENSNDDVSYSGSYQINNTTKWIEKASIKSKENYNGTEQLSEFYLQQKV